MTEILVGNSSISNMWSPEAGEECFALVERKLPDSSDRRKVIQETSKILAKCIDPNSTDNCNTQLVVGYVQSGKTLSFTALSAMAADNGFKIIIIIAGTTLELADQSKARLIGDLNVESGPFGKWKHFHNPGPESAEAVESTLNSWRKDDALSMEKRVLLFTVLKQHVRLEALSALLDHIEYLSDVPVLIIDDEADQASLNSLVKQGELSTTYRKLNAIRSQLPLHSFVQYTATPQANLLISLIDTLSPDTATLIEPGDDYVGVGDFVRPENRCIEIIPSHEIPSKKDPLEAPPQSLLYALQIFLVGVASGLLDQGATGKNRSMMIHPAREIIEHHQYFVWVREILRAWNEQLDSSYGSLAKAKLLKDFRKAYDDLNVTVADLQDWDSIEPIIASALRMTIPNLRELNSASELRDINWKTEYSWILVGGQVLDRGFTVEGLTVTYMPRGPGVRNADTIQQRARFLGYKRKFIGFCRVFLEQDVAELYKAYVEHERDIRHCIGRHEETGLSLKELRRTFVCDRSMRPTRDSVLAIGYSRTGLSKGGWFEPRHVPESYVHVNDNKKLVSDFILGLESGFLETSGDERRSEVMRHYYSAGIPLERIFQELLGDYRVGNIADTNRWATLLLLLDKALSDDEMLKASIVIMSKGAIERKRKVEDGRILNLFQGPHPDSKGEIYKGDRAVIGNDPVTIQIHFTTLFERFGSKTEVLFEKAPLLTVWVDRELRKDFITQQRPAN